MIISLDSLITRRRLDWIGLDWIGLGYVSCQVIQYDVEMKNISDTMKWRKQNKNR